MALKTAGTLVPSRVWLALAALAVAALALLMVDTILYPAAPVGNPSQDTPEWMVVWRDVAFFTLVVLGVFCLCVFLWSHRQSQFGVAALTGLTLVGLLIACVVYLFVYKYVLAPEAQAGSAASNFNYVALWYVALTVTTLVTVPHSCRGCVV